MVESSETPLLSNSSADQGKQDEEIICPYCKNLIDPEMCWCGDYFPHSPWEGHVPVPMGCICGYVERK